MSEEADKVNTELLRRLERLRSLRIEHRDLDEVVRRLADQPGIDELLLKRMKKRKLQMKDQNERLRSSLIPDLDA